MKRAVGLLAILAIAGTLAGCAQPPQPPYQRQAQFIESEYLSYAGKGTGRLSGQAFTKTRGGDVKFAAGNTIYLNPVTTYSKEWFANGIKANRNMSPPDERAREYRREAIADGNGNFEFSDLPAGDYYVATGIFWEVPSGQGLQRTGSNVGEKVTIKDGETTKAVVH